MRKYLAAASLLSLIGSASSCGTETVYISHQIEFPTPLGLLEFNCDSSIDICRETRKPVSGEHYCLENSEESKAEINAETEYDDDGRLKLLDYELCIYSSPDDCIKGSCTEGDETPCGQAFITIDDFVQEEMEKL